MENSGSKIERLWQALQRDNGGNKASTPDAEFIGWQETMDGGAIPLYVIKSRHHPLYRSTVSENTLRHYNLEIPPTPDREGQRRRIDSEER